MADRSGKGGLNTLKFRPKNNDDWVTLTGLKPGVVYPFEIDYIADDSTNVTSIVGVQ